MWFSKKYESRIGNCFFMTCFSSLWTFQIRLCYLKLFAYICQSQICQIHLVQDSSFDLIFLWLQGQILKQNRNDDMRARMVLPSVNDPNVLVLQGVKKAARGNYSCRVGNGIPTHDFEVQSDPIFLDVKCKYTLYCISISTQVLIFY